MDIKVETQIKLNKFKLRPYQIPILDAIENKGYKRVIAILPRRAGKDLTALHLCIRECLKKVCTIFYIFPTYSQGRKILWDAITNDGIRVLDYIPDELVESKNIQLMQIRFKNGSLLQVVGSDKYNSIVGTNCHGAVFSEYALQSPMVYPLCIKPILEANDGWALFISCVSPNTLVLTSKGFIRIKDVSPIRERYSELNEPVYGIGGFHNAEQFYYGGKQPTIKIKLESGYRLECTPVHPIWDGRSWVKSKDLKVGDLIPIQYGQNVDGEGVDISDFYYSEHAALKSMDINYDGEDFFYLLGLIHADGNYTKDSVCVTKKKDQQIIDFLRKYGFKTRPDGIHHEYSSREFCALLEYLGFKHGARNKEFPESLLKATMKQLKPFIQGLFDGDGCSASGKNKRGYVKLTSTCLEFINDLQVVLLNFGIVSSIRYEYKAPSELVKVYSEIYNLEISGYFAHIFYKEIGFRLDRKQKNWANVPESCREESGNIYPIDLNQLDGYSLPKNIVTNKERISRRLIAKLNEKNPHPYLSGLLSHKYFYSPVKDITDSESEVFDFVIPDTHSFFTNGYLSHNTPRGKNHLFELYNIALNSPDWFAYKLSVLETGHISMNAINKTRAEGIMSEGLIQQEYFCDFSLGIEGSFYCRYIDKMKLSGQIGCVPWLCEHKVHTCWDLGVRDTTAILFFQVVGQIVRIVDCYENSKQGLEHYVKVLESKPYSYGKHIAPHDIRVREFGSGITRLEKAARLGINFIVCDNLPILDGIEAARSSFGKIWVDEEACKDLIRALENYHQEFDSARKVYKEKPLHDWSSNYSDAFRYLCISLPKMYDDVSPEELDKRYREAVYGEQSNMAPIFRSYNTDY